MAGSSGTYRFFPGTVLQDRYRLDDQLGRGAKYLAEVVQFLVE